MSLTDTAAGVADTYGYDAAGTPRAPGGHCRRWRRQLLARPAGQPAGSHNAEGRQDRRDELPDRRGQQPPAGRDDGDEVHSI
ncbi:MAG: hypothetical protein V4713_16690 [Pseudomonadota bacterium]